MTYILSDIHGEYDLFIGLLQKINFSPNDEMIVCGDMIDKGQDSVKLLRFIKSEPNIRCIIGNHEYDFLKHYWAIMRNSPDDFDKVLENLQACFPYDGKLLDWETVDWLESLPYYIEEDEYICVHAGIPLDSDNRPVASDQASKEQLVYDRLFKEPSIVPLTEKCIFFGHTPTSCISNDNKIIRYRRGDRQTNSVGDYYKIHLDTGVWLCGVLGCFCIETCKEYYVYKRSSV